MLVSRAVTENLTKASWIRRMFEEGARLKQERGADKVFDFTLGNPEIEPPAAVLAAARRVLDSETRHLHAYMPNAGHPKVREAVARRISAATGLPYTANHILMTVGAGAALNTVLKAMLDPGDEVITVAPFFAEYGFYAENHGGRLVVVPPNADLTPDVGEDRDRHHAAHARHPPQLPQQSERRHLSRVDVRRDRGGARTAPPSRSPSSATSPTRRSSSTT